MNLKSLLAGLFVLATATTQAANVACVGNSITYGYGLSDGKYSYPTRLQELLGSNYTVTNFGVSSMTFATYGNQSYWSTDRFTAAMNSNPNMVVIELGTNDSKFFMGNYADQGIYNWAYGQVSKADLQRDYRALIDTFAHLSTKPEIFATLQPYSNNVSWTITDTAIVNVINPIIFDAAVEKGVNIIDLHSLFHTPSWYLSDSVHPNEDGAYELAKIIYNHVSQAKPVVSVSGSTLKVDAGYGFYWYKDGVLISGANAQTYNATEKGSYKALVKIDAATDSYLMTDAVETGGSGTIDISCVNIDTTLAADCSKAEGLYYEAPVVEYTDLLGNKYSAVPTRSDGKQMTDIFPWGQTSVTWSFTLGNKQITCPQTIKVVNSIPSIAECPELKDITISSDTASVIDKSMFGNPLAIIGCNDSVAGVLTRDDGKSLSDAFPVDTTMLTWTYTLDGNVLACKQKVMVESAGLQVDCVLPDRAYYADAENCGADIQMDSIWGRDMQGNIFRPVSVTRDDSLDLNDIYPIGITSVTWNFKVGERTGSCEQKIIVIDTIAPVFDCSSLKDTVIYDALFYDTIHTHAEVDPSTVIPMDPVVDTLPRVEINLNGTAYAPLCVYAQDCEGLVAGTLAYEQIEETNNYILIWTFTDASQNSTVCRQNATISYAVHAEKLSSDVKLSYENGQLYIGDNGYELLTVDVYDMQGRLISSKEIVGGVNRVNLGLKAGAYVVVLRNVATKVASLKIME